MKENKGHARCNAAGLKYISEKEDFDYVVPMDGAPTYEIANCIFYFNTNSNLYY